MCQLPSLVYCFLVTVYWLLFKMVLGPYNSWW